MKAILNLTEIHGLDRGKVLELIREPALIRSLDFENAGSMYLRRVLVYDQLKGYRQIFKSVFFQLHYAPIACPLYLVEFIPFRSHYVCAVG